jgi:hypothetical protein
MVMLLTELGAMFAQKQTALAPRLGFVMELHSGIGKLGTPHSQVIRTRQPRRSRRTHQGMRMTLDQRAKR